MCFFWFSNFYRFLPFLRRICIIQTLFNAYISQLNMTRPNASFFFNNWFIFSRKQKCVQTKQQYHLHATASSFTFSRVMNNYFFFLDFSQNSFDICKSEKFNHNRSNWQINSLKNNSQIPSFKIFYQSLFIFLQLKISQHL